MTRTSTNTRVREKESSEWGMLVPMFVEEKPEAGVKLQKAYWFTPDDYTCI
jgi:hypothetical protein